METKENFNGGHFGIRCISLSQILGEQETGLITAKFKKIIVEI